MLTLNFDIHTHTHTCSICRLTQQHTQFHFTIQHSHPFTHRHLQQLQTHTAIYTIPFRKFIAALWPYIQNNFGLEKPQAQTSQLYHSLRYMFKILSRVGRVMYNPTFQHKSVLYTSATHPFSYSRLVTTSHAGMAAKSTNWINSNVFIRTRKPEINENGLKRSTRWGKRALQSTLL